MAVQRIERRLNVYYCTVGRPTLLMPWLGVALPTLTPDQPWVEESAMLTD